MTVQTFAAIAGLLMALTGPAMAQGVAPPDSNMSGVSGNAGAANNGIGQQGRLTAHNGGHASTLTGPAAAAQIPIDPKPVARPGNDPQVENEPALGGGHQ